MSIDVNTAASILITQLENHKDTYFDRDVAKALEVFNSATGTLNSKRAVTICTLLKNAHHIAPPVGKVPFLSNAYAVLNNLASRIKSIAFGKLFKPAWISSQELLPAAMNKCLKHVSPEFAFNCAAIDIAKDMVRQYKYVEQTHGKAINELCSFIQKSVNIKDKQSETLTHLEELFRYLIHNKLVPEENKNFAVSKGLDSFEEAEGGNPVLSKKNSPLALALSEHLSLTQIEDLKAKNGLNLPDIEIFPTIGITISSKAFDTDFDQTVRKTLQEDQQRLPNMTKTATKLLRHSPEYSFYLLNQAESWLSLSKGEREKAATNLLHQSISTLYGIDKERIRAVLKSLGMEEPAFLSGMVGSSFSINSFDRKDKPSSEYPYAYILSVKKTQGSPTRDVCLGFFKAKEIPIDFKTKINQVLKESNYAFAEEGTLVSRNVDKNKASIQSYKLLDVNYENEMIQALASADDDWDKVTNAT